MPILDPFVMFPGYAQAIRRLESLRKRDLKPLFERWLDLIVEDNRVCVMSGIDKKGRPLPEVTYRKGGPLKVEWRVGKGMGTRKGRFKGFRKGGMTTKFGVRLPNNNLSNAEYKLLDGPPLAPRGEHSRIISNLAKGTPRKQGGGWIVECAWLDVVDAKGKPFLHHHFTGEGPRGRALPQRDLRGVSLYAIEQAVKSLLAYLNAVGG